jgi:menaquinone-dependent protoporphyrinogen IX oxidase
MQSKSVSVEAKGIVVYRGKYGATQQYAEWIGEELQLPLISPDNLNPELLQMNDYVTICSSVYIGKLLIKDWLLHNQGVLKNKKLFLLIVCGTAASEKQKRDEIIETNIPGALLGSCEIFFAPGRLVKNKLSWKDRWLLRIGTLFEKDPVKKDAMMHDIDDVKKEHIEDLIKSIRLFVSDRNSFLHTLFHKDLDSSGS